MTSQGSGKPIARKLELANAVASLVYEVVHSWDERMERAVAGVRARLGVELTARQALAMWHLHEPATMGDLARGLACDQSNVTGLVDRLERQGYVRRAVDQRDRRVKRVELTDDGVRVRHELDGLLRANPALEQLAEADLVSLQRLLTRLLHASRETMST